MNSTRPDQAINPARPAAGPTPPVRQVVRLDADYLGACARPKPAGNAIEPEEEQLIVLPRRPGSWLARLSGRLFG